MTDTFQPKATSVRAQQFDGSPDSAKALQDWLGDTFTVSLVIPMKPIHPNLANVQGGAPASTVGVLAGSWLVLEGTVMRMLTDEAFKSIYQPSAA